MLINTHSVEYYEVQKKKENKKKEKKKEKEYIED